MSENSYFRKPSTGGWRSAIFIIFVEVGERFAYYGVSGNLFMYLTKVLGQSAVTAAKNVNTWQGVSAIFPVVGGFLADSYLGRFKTILLSSIIYLIGLILLTLAVSTVSISSRPTVFFIALYILAVGEGGHKPCVQTFAADQFDDDLPEERAAKSSFFNWWYVGIVCGATAAVLVVIYVEDFVGWNFGFGMLVVAVAAALVVFLIGSRSYRRQAPVGSPFTRAAQVVVAAWRKRRLAEAEARGICNEEEISAVEDGVVRPLACTHRFRFLEKAMMMDSKDSASEKRNPWRLCSTKQVEEVKLLLQLIPIWVSCLMFAVVTSQLGTYFTKQGAAMQRSLSPSFQIPPASFQVFTGLTILLSVPIYERAFVPAARAFTAHPSGVTVLQRIGLGLILSVLLMAVAACVEYERKRARIVSIWWLIPQYVLCGLVDMLAVVGLQELFYHQVPPAMRSVGAAAYVSVIGVGNFLSAALISVVHGVSARVGDEWLGDDINAARLDYFYWLLAAMSAVNFCFYVLLARRFAYKEIIGHGDGDGQKGSG